MTQESFKFPKVTLIGSFRRDHEGLERSYRELLRNQCQVLSPRSIAFIDPAAFFVRNKVEQGDERAIEAHHLEAIALSDFVWLHAPKGYVGLSAAMEIGYAHAQKVPIYSRDAVEDGTLKSFVIHVGSVFEAIEHSVA